MMNAQEQELISKKELLQQTGISFGQLYRWKRQKLIPENWFIKKSSYTGQETFFPKQLILNRIQMIVEYKKKYSLDELTELLSPQIMSKSLYLDEVAELLGMKTTQVYTLIRSEQRFAHLTFMEATLLYLLTRIEQQVEIAEASILRYTASIEYWTEQMEHSGYKLYVMQEHGHLSFSIIDGEASLYPDVESKLIAVYDVEAVASEVNQYLSQFML